MASGGEGANATSKLQDNGSGANEATGATAAANAQEPAKQAGQLEEDDEFEDFPVEDWPDEETEAAAGNNAHLWEESWDDDDENEDFSKVLKEELAKVRQGK